MRHHRLLLLLLSLAGMTCAVLFGQSQRLLVEREGGFLRVSAPQLRVLEGKPLEQLRNGAAVTYVFELTIASDQGGAALVQTSGRFIFSFDLWEEKFRVVQAGTPGRSASQLTAADAQAWCLESLRPKLPALGPEEAFVIRLECRAYADESESGSNNNGSALTLAGLVDVFSRKNRNPPPQWFSVAGPLRLADIKERKKQKP